LPGALLLHLVLQLVNRWSFLTLFIVYFFAIFREFFPHFLDYVLLHVFCCVMMSTFFFFSQLAHCFCVGVVTSTLVVITNNACCRLLSNFNALLPHFVLFCFCYVTMQAFSNFLVGELLILINVVSLCFIFIRIYIFCKCIMPSMSMSASLAYISLPWHLFLHLAFNATASHLHGACSYIAHAPLFFLHHTFSYFPLLFCIILFIFVLICSWNQFLVVH
jgi:hypothetical protein